MPEAFTMASAPRRSCPITSTRSTANGVAPSNHRDSHAAATTRSAPMRLAPHHAPRRRARRRTRWRLRLPSSRCPAMAASGSARSPRRRAAPRGERTARRPLMPLSISLVPHDADLRLEGEPEVGLHALAGHLHEGQDVPRHGPTAVDDEVGVLGRDLGAVEPLALQADLFDQAGRHLALRVLPHASRGGEGQRLCRLLLLETLPHVLLDLGLGAAVKLQPRAHQYGAGRRGEGAVAEAAVVGLELAEGTVRVEEVHGRDEVTDPAIGRARVHGHGAPDGRGNSHQALDPAEVQGGRLPDQGGETHPGARHRLLAIEVGTPEATLELEHHATDAAVADQEVIAAAHDLDGQLLALGEAQGQPDVLDVLGNDEDVRRPPDAQGGMEAEGFLEPHLAPNLSED